MFRVSRVLRLEKFPPTFYAKSLPSPAPSPIQSTFLNKKHFFEIHEIHLSQLTDDIAIVSLTAVKT